MSLSQPGISRLLQHSAQQLLREGRVLVGQAPLDRTSLNTRFAQVQALLRQAGYAPPLQFCGYRGKHYALYDPARCSELEVLRWLQRMPPAGTTDPSPALQRGRPCARCPDSARGNAAGVPKTPLRGLEESRNATASN